MKLGNQFIIKIADSHHFPSYEETMAAARNLSGVGFKMWTYFIYREPGSEFCYSSADLCEQTKICIDSARKTFHSLVEKGYMIQDGEEHFIFN